TVPYGDQVTHDVVRAVGDLVAAALWACHLHGRGPIISSPGALLNNAPGPLPSGSFDANNSTSFSRVITNTCPSHRPSSSAISTYFADLIRMLTRYLCAAASIMCL